MAEPNPSISPELQATISFPQPEHSKALVASPEAPELNKNPFKDNNSIGTHSLPQLQEPSASPPDISTTGPSQSPPPQNASPVGDPRVAGLRAMFPDYDEAILFSVLQSADGNQETAIEILLGMSDPEYKPEATAPVLPAMTQEELDEQLARRLMLEEDEHQARLYDQRINRPSQNPQRRNSKPQEGVYQPPPGPQGPGAMSEIQGTITKAAEVSKKTLGGLFTKVKAKIQEFEQGRSTTTTQEPQWIVGYDPQQHPPQHNNYAQYHHGSAGAGASPPQASYYDPNAPSPVISEQTISPPSRTPAPAFQGYDASPNAPAPAPTPPQSLAAPSVPPPASSATPIDGGKLGLLPKKPVSLVRDPPSSGQHPRRSLDSDDGLEYAENPFEDQKK